MSDNQSWFERLAVELFIKTVEEVFRFVLINQFYARKSFPKSVVMMRITPDALNPETPSRIVFMSLQAVLNMEATSYGVIFCKA